MPVQSHPTFDTALKYLGGPQDPWLWFSRSLDLSFISFKLDHHHDVARRQSS